MKIGLFAIGLDTYWEQFEGLKERLEKYLSIVEKKLAGIHPQIINAGLIDNIDKSFEAGIKFRKEDVDIIFYTLQRMHYRQQFCLLCKKLKCLLSF